jgi:hypothetical protein
MSTIQKSYLYKVYRNGIYLGNLPYVSSDFTYNWDINTAGVQLQVICNISPDVTNQSPPYLTEEDGSTILTTEDGLYLTTDSVAEIVSAGETAGNFLFRNGNQVKVYEISSNNINGKIVFQGTIERIEADFGGDSDQTSTDEQIQLLVYSDGQDLNNYVVPGSDADTLDQSQTTFDDADTAWDLCEVGFITQRLAQTFVVGAGVTNLHSISVRLTGDTTGTQPVVINLWLSTSVGVGSPLGSVSFVPAPFSSGFNNYTISFPTPIPVTSGETYAFELSAPLSDLATGPQVSSANTNAYANGGMYTQYATNPWRAATASDNTTPDDLYFQTYYSSYSVNNTFSSEDPSAILKTIIDSYVAAGGLIDYDTGTVDTTGVSATYTFSLASIFEAIQTCLALSPFNFYWYVDLGTDTLYFKKASTSADITLTKGKQINALALVMTTENIVNLEYFSGGKTGVTNLFSQYSDQASIQAFGLRLSRQSDNRVTVQDTADILGAAYIDENKSEQFQTQVTILDSSMDTTVFKPGLNIGFAGFGTFVDALVMQIVQIIYKPEQVTLILGRIPPRTNRTLQEAANAINALQTIDNPSAPS